MPVRLLQVTALAAFFCVTNAADASMLSKGSTGIPYRSNGKTASFGDGPSTSVPNTNLGNGSIGNTGFYVGSEALAHPSNPASFLELGAKGDVYAFPGTKYPFQAGYQAPAHVIADAAISLLGGPLGAALTLGLASYPYIKGWFDDAGVRPNDSGGLEVKGDDNRDFACDVGKYYSPGGYAKPPIGSQSKDACGDFPAGTVFLDAASVNKNVTACTVRNTCHPSVIYAQWNSGRGLEDGWLPASMDDIAPYLKRTPFRPGMVGDIVSAGGEIPLPSPNITGPTSIQGPPVTSTSTGTQTINGQPVPTRTETTSQTTYNFTTNNNQVTNTTNNTTTTTTTTNQSTGVVISTTTTDTESKPEEKDDRSECEKYPKQLNCAELDTPKDEIPKKQIDVSFSPIDLGLGGGSCPAPVQIGPDKQFSYQATCDNLTLIKPMVIAIALFIGGMIIFGGRAEQ